jgi:hypothetical protein
MNEWTFQKLAYTSVCFSKLDEKPYYYLLMIYMNKLWINHLLTHLNGSTGSMSKLKAKNDLCFDRLWKPTPACFSKLEEKPYYWSIVVEIHITVHYVLNFRFS